MLHTRMDSEGMVLPSAESNGENDLGREEMKTGKGTNRTVALEHNFFKLGSVLSMRNLRRFLELFACFRKMDQFESAIIDSLCSTLQIFDLKVVIRISGGKNFCRAKSDTLNLLNYHKNKLKLQT